jgi:hypothetical protein
MAIEAAACGARQLARVRRCGGEIEDDDQDIVMVSSSTDASLRQQAISVPSARPVADLAQQIERPGYYAEFFDDPDWIVPSIE